jgi:hypothetical protein
MELKEILRAMLFITAVVSFGITVLSMYTFIKLKKTPKKERNLMDFQKVPQYTRLAKVSIGVSVISFLLALWLS